MSPEIIARDFPFYIFHKRPGIFYWTHHPHCPHAEGHVLVEYVPGVIYTDNQGPEGCMEYVDW